MFIMKIRTRQKVVLRRSEHRRGSALILAIVITMILFILGIAFVSTSRSQKETVKSMDTSDELSTAVDTVVDQIDTVLVNDLFGKHGFLSDRAAYDYPDANNKWLASLEPRTYEDNNTGVIYYWPHITDLWNKFGGVSRPQLNYHYDPDPQFRFDQNGQTRNYGPQWDYTYNWDPTVMASPVSWWYIVEGSIFMKCRVVAEHEGILPTLLNCMANAPWSNGYNASSLQQQLGLANPIPSWWVNHRSGPGNWENGMRADADGDGIADSRWVRLYRTGPEGDYVYAAVRIIDNGGMLNINTAYREPPANSGLDWDGTRVTDVDLEGICSPSDNPAMLHQYRCGGKAIDELNYNRDVAIRLNDPVTGYQPFGIDDELALRNRFFLAAPALTRSATAWPATLNPGPGATGKAIPYQMPLNQPYDIQVEIGELGNWFNKASDLGSIGNYNRRHICTTYNVDRIVRPSYAASLKSGMKSVSNQRQVWLKLPYNGMGNYSGFSSLSKKDDYIKELAGGIYRGLPKDSVIQARFGSDYTREKLAWQYAVNMVDYQDRDDIPSYITVGDTTYWGVEGVQAIKRDTLYISELGYVNYDNILDDPTKPKSGPYYAIELYNPDTNDKLIMKNDYYIKVGNNPPMSLSQLFQNSGISKAIIKAGKTVVITSCASETDAQEVFNGHIDTSATILQYPGLTFSNNTTSILISKKDWPAGSGVDMPVDYGKVPDGVVSPGDHNVHTKERKYKMATGDLLVPGKMFWGDSMGASLGTVPVWTVLADNSQTPPVPFTFQLDVTNRNLRSVGEIENVLAVGYSSKGTGTNVQPDNCHILAKDIIESLMLLQQHLTEPQTNANMQNYGRIDLKDKDYWGLMNFLMWMDPSHDGIGATYRDIYGRININTAPWYVIAQLPWLKSIVEQQNAQNPQEAADALAKAIVAFRDKQALPVPDLGAGKVLDYRNRATATGLPADKVSETPGFTNIAQLLHVINSLGADSTAGAKGATLNDYDIRKYLDYPDNSGNYGQPLPVSAPGANTTPYYDCTTYTYDVNGQTPPQPQPRNRDFLQRDILFQRISNLVTVRSDVFTAYILVRIGRDGPQRRVMAIFDRSNVYSKGQKPRLRALQLVPDPR